MEVGAVIEVRQMTAADIDAVTAVVEAAHEQEDRQAGEQERYFRQGMERFVARDPEGAWVAVDRDSVVGMAEAIRRGPFWGLSMLHVHPASQSAGVGRRLLDAALTYARGAELRMILTSSDPRALRRYSLAGLAIHPAVEAEGKIDRTALPAGLPGRSGEIADLDLVEAVDAGLRGSRAEDVEYLLTAGARMEVIDGDPGRGYAVYRSGRLGLLGATDDTTAAQLLWRVLADIGEEAEIWGLTAAQDWAVRVALAARLSVAGAGPLFMSGRDHPPGPWIPSGWYF